MNDSYLHETLELLRDVRVEVHGGVDDSIVEQLDEAIRLLEEAQHSQSAKLSRRDALIILGKVIEHLPTIVRLIELIRHIK